MSQKDPRFRKSQKPTLYREAVVRLRARPRTITELLGDLVVTVDWDVPPTMAGLESNLRRWRAAGAFYDAPNGRQPRVWHANRNAMAKHIVQAALGPVHGLLPDENTGQTVAVMVSELGQVSREPVAPIVEPDVTVHKLTRFVDEMPREFWNATMTRDGVLISYDQYHRVIAMLTAITEVAS